MSWVVGSGCGCGCGCGSWVCVNVVGKKKIPKKKLNTKSPIPLPRGHKANKRILYKYKWTLKRHLGGK